jgi:hypothetical protein
MKIQYIFAFQILNAFAKKKNSKISNLIEEAFWFPLLHQQSQKLL